MLVWCFFSRLEDEAVLRLPIDRIAPNSVSWAFAGNSTGFEHWQRENIIFSRLPRFWRFFGAFSAVSKTTLSCAYPLTELHQTRFLGLLQAIPLELSVETGKHHYKQFATLRRFFGAWAFAGHSTGIESSKRENIIISRLPRFWRFFWRFFGRLEDNAVLHLPIDQIAPNSYSWAFGGHSTGIERWKRENIIISRLPRFWRFFGAFSAVSKTTLSCTYPLTELHQTRFLGLLQASPPESYLGNS